MREPSELRARTSLDSLQAARRADANVRFRPKADTHEAQMEISSEVKLKLNCLTVRSEDELIRWAVRAFELPSEQLPHTEYTADFTCGCIARNVAKTRIFYCVRAQ